MIQPDKDLYSDVKALAEKYSELNAYIGYLLKTYAAREDQTAIEIRARLLAIRSSFLSCVGGLSNTISTITPEKPYFSVVSQVVYYTSNIRPLVTTMQAQHDELRNLMEGEGEVQRKAVEDLGELISAVDKLLGTITGRPAS